MMAPEQLLVHGVEEIFGRLMSTAFDEVKLVWGVKGDVEGLQNVLISIQAVLQDAEKKQVEKEAVRLWLKDLKEVAYDADNVLDEIAYETLRRQIEIQNSFWNKVRDFFTLSNPVVFLAKIAHKIKDINQKLGEIDRKKEMFKFSVDTSCINPHGMSSENSSTKKSESSSVSDSNIVGRDSDKLKIINMLRLANHEDMISVISIVGFGGLGKTALAQSVFNDIGVQNDFGLRMWLCVSNDFDVKRLLKEMIQSPSTNGTCKASNMDVVQRTLQEKLKGKRFLLVLDDMWIETQFREKWDNLIKVVRCGAVHGSKIMITTRNRKVASIAGMDHLKYDLQILSDDDCCWEIFKRAFCARGANIKPKFEECFREIVKKCGGVPLAIKCLGGTMSSKTEDKWLDIKDSEIWEITDANEQILSILKLSYDSLPPPLKKCFLYCSIFPKDHQINKKILVHLWMAEGFLGPSGRNKMEDVGNKYFNTLYSNSFFQDAVTNRFGEIIVCKMHDLVHDLAQSINGADCLVVKDDKMPLEDVSKTYYMGFIFDELEGFPKDLCSASKLRTFYVQNYSRKNFDLFLNFKFLRTLTVEIGSRMELPFSIDELKHLRFLHLSGGNFIELPKSITCLHMLQTLKLTRCRIQKLPDEIWKLTNLRHLDMNGCAYWDGRIPKGFGQLTCLQTLPIFTVDKEDSGRGITELEYLSDIQGMLTIQCLENVRDVRYAKMANLKGKKNIGSLRLEWSWDANGNVTNDDELVLEALQPHSNLKELRIEGFRGANFPIWICALGSLVEIALYNCNKCEYLPSFGPLLMSSLKNIEISRLTNLKRWGDYNCEGAGATSVSSTTTDAEVRIADPSLKEVGLHSMSNLEEWLEPALAFSCVECLWVEWCPKLRRTPTLFPSLKDLRLQSTSGEAVRSITSNLTSLTKLKIYDIDNLPDSFLENNKFLETLEIGRCPELQVLQLRLLTRLKDLKLTNCDSLQFIDLQGSTSLRTLVMRNCHSLKRMPEDFASLTRVERLELTGFSAEFDYSTFVAAEHHVHSLRSLRIRDSTSL